MSYNQGTASSFSNILVIKDNIREPDSVRWNTDRCDAQVVLRLPSQFHVNPFLQQEDKNGMFLDKLETKTEKLFYKILLNFTSSLAKSCQNSIQKFLDLLFKNANK